MGKTRRRGSALVIATILIFITASMVTLLLAAPSAQLNRVMTGTAKERSALIADAGLRDAIQFLNSNQANLSAWLAQPGTAGGVPNLVLISGTARPAGSSAPRTAVSPSPTGATLIQAEATTAGVAEGWVDDKSPGTPYWNVNKVPTGFFQTGNFVQFGDPVAARGRYAFLVTPRGNGYYRVDVEGQAQNATGGGSTPTISTRLVAFVFRGTSQAQFSGLMFANPTGGPWNDVSTGNRVPGGPRLRWDTTSANPFRPQYSGNDAAGATNVPGALLQPVGGDPINLNLFKGATGSSTPAFVQGADATTGANGAQGNATITRPTGQLQFADQVVQQVESLPNGYDLGNGYTLSKYFYVHDPADVPSKYSAPPGYTLLDDNSPITMNGASGTINGIVYIKVPAQGGWGSDRVELLKNTGLFRMNGNTQLNGVVILDVGDNVFIDDDQPMFDMNGNPNKVNGSFLFYQRGRVQVENGNTWNMKLFGAAGRGEAFLWNSDTVNKAIGGLTGNPMYKIASYIVE